MTALAGSAAVQAGRQPGHRYALRVYYEDTDAGGMVYHARYLHFAERARSELLWQHGIDQAQMLAAGGPAFAVRDCRIAFLRPARLGDGLEVHSRVLALAGASATLQQSVLRDEGCLVDLEVRVVAVRPDGKPTRLPGALRRVLAGYLTNSNVVG